MLPRSRLVSGVSSDGFSTTLLPVARAGARLFDPIIIGWLNELRMPATPIGNRVVYVWYGPGIWITSVRSAMSSAALYRYHSGRRASWAFVSPIGRPLQSVSSW